MEDAAFLFQFFLSLLFYQTKLTLRRWRGDRPRSRTISFLSNVWSGASPVFAETSQSGSTSKKFGSELVRVCRNTGSVDSTSGSNFDRADMKNYDFHFDGVGIVRGVADPAQRALRTSCVGYIFARVSPSMHHFFMTSRGRSRGIINSSDIRSVPRRESSQERVLSPLSLSFFPLVASDRKVAGDSTLQENGDCAPDRPKNLPLQK